ncbi:unnamed protein product [Fusarium graminearum]|uniref:Chromosome 4, complete genome n=2 Tax=Gibberella zeae (strain ATCC MYA-4620 / CBS 123657 / FGSC 9075 / NRRL 31084 / PH-1) TaxID=229533 RepID=A0A098DUJ1_GIBZE|nr:unnamed protein product [Fusarium graminearum]
MVIHDCFNLDIVENDTSRDDDVDMDRDLEQELPNNDDDMEAESEAERKRAIREGKKSVRPNQAFGLFPVYNPDELRIIQQGFSESPEGLMTTDELEEYFIPGRNRTIARPPPRPESLLDSITVKPNPPPGKKRVGRPRNDDRTAKKPKNRRGGSRPPPVNSNAHQTYNTYLHPGPRACQRFGQQHYERQEDAPTEVRANGTPHYLSIMANRVTLDHGRKDIFDGIDPIVARQTREFFARTSIEPPKNNKALYILHHFMMKREEENNPFFKELKTKKRIKILKKDPLTDEEKAQLKKLLKSLTREEWGVDNHVEAWDDLSWGVKWVILWILNRTNRFAKIVSLILHLRHRQAREFTEQYTRQYFMWEIWKENVERIPHAALLEHALEKRQTVAELLQQYRPPLYTEQISRQDEEKGMFFLINLNNTAVTEEFKAFMHEKQPGFLRLDIEWDFIQETIDNQQILASVGIGWLNPSEVAKVMMRSLPKKVSEQNAGMRDPLSTITLSGATFEDEGHDSDMSQNEVEPTDDSQALEMGKRLVELEAHDEEVGLEDLPLPEAPLLPLIPGPHGPQATPDQQQMLRFALQRTAPESYSIVHGFYASRLVSTLEEEERAPFPAQSAFRPRGFPFYARHIAGIVGHSDEDPVGEVLGGSESQCMGSTDQQLARHGTLSARVRSSPQIAKRGSFNLGQQTGSSSAMQNSRNESGYYSKWQVNNLVNPPNVEHNTFGPSTRSIPHQLQEPEAATTPSKQLRQMLEKYQGFLTKSNKEEKGASTDDDSDDGTVMELGDVAPPEPENDEDYCPKKKSARKPPKKKTTAVRKSGRPVGRPRKATLKKNNTATPKNVGDTEAGESSTLDSFDVQKTPTKKQTGDIPLDSGPPSSGRIKLIVRPSQTSTSNEPNNPKPEVTMPRIDTPTPSRARVSKAKYAISAQYATYASMSTSARFAQTAVDSAKGIADTATLDAPSNIIDPNKLILGFSNIKKDGKQHVDRAEFAWRAERAEFAGTAFEADDALQILARGEHGDAKGTD